jgi:hypothetical protein
MTQTLKLWSEFCVYEAEIHKVDMSYLLVVFEQSRGVRGTMQ